MITEGFKWTPVAVVDKFDEDQVEYVRRVAGVRRPNGTELAAFCKPYDTREVHGNALTTAGLNRITAVLIGGSTGTIDSTRVRLGVGDNTTAFSLTDAGLSTGSNQYFRVMDSTYPQQSNGVITLKSTYADAEADFAWQCWGIDLGTATVTSSATPAAVLVNRKVTSLGTKVSGSWVLTVTITFS